MIANLVAEKGVIASVLASPEAFWEVQRHRISADHFTDPAFRALFAAVSSAVDGGKQHKADNFAAELPPELPGGRGTVATIASLKAYAKGPDAAPAIDHVRSLSSAYEERIAERNWTEGEKIRRAHGPAAAIEFMAGQSESLRAATRGRFVTTLREAADAALQETAANYQAGGTKRRTVGLETGIIEVDGLIGSLFPGNLVTLAGRSGNGKTALLFQALLNISAPSLDASATGSVLIKSMEMKDKELGRRYLARATGLATRKQRAGDVTQEEFHKLTTAARSASERFIIDSEGPQTARNIARDFRIAHAQHGIVAGGVDHLRKILPENSRWSPLETVVDAIEILKQTARDLGIVMFPLAQVTRDSMRGGDWRINSDHIWGGNRIEEESDVVLAVSIPRKWLNQNKPEQHEEKAWDRWVRQTEEWKDKAEIAALKTRDDEGGERRAVKFDGPRLWFGEEQIQW